MTPGPATLHDMPVVLDSSLPDFRLTSSIARLHASWIEAQVVVFRF